MATNSQIRTPKKEKTIHVPNSENTISSEGSSLSLSMKNGGRLRAIKQEDSSIPKGQSSSDIYEEEIRQIESAEETEHEEIESAKSL